MSENAVADAVSTLHTGVEELACAAAGSVDAAIASLTVCEQHTRRVEFLHVSVVGDLLRDGEFAARGYRSPAHALADLLGCDTIAARRRVRVAEDICPRSTLDGQPLPPRLPATGAEFATGRIGLRHVEVIAEAFAHPGRAAAGSGRLSFSTRTGKITGRLDGLTRELLGTALDGLTAPRGDGDDRTPAQRRADALGEICSRVPTPASCHSPVGNAHT